MEHIAIDLGGRESQICVRNQAGDILEERRCPTLGLGGYLATRPKSRVVLETCAEAFRVADAAAAAGHEVRVVAATLVRSLGVGARRTKTDRRDARVLSEVSCRIDLPSVHVPTAAARERKTMCGMRETLVRARTQVANSIHGWLRTQGVRVPTGDVASLATRVRRQVLDRPNYVERELEILDELSARIRLAETELRRLARTDPVCLRRTRLAPHAAVRCRSAVQDMLS